MSIPALLVVLTVAVLAALVVVYNRLIGLRNRAEAAWSDIDVQLRRRHDLVGNLLEAVRGYAAHERRTLEEVVLARARATEAESAGPAAAGRAETELTARLAPIFALAEGYPDLKASRSYRDLHTALVVLEDDLQNARRYYNAVVRDFNTAIQSFPQLLIARPMGFGEREFFQLGDPLERAVPSVADRRPDSLE